MPELENPQEKQVNTEFGEPTDKLVAGTIHGVPVVVLSRYVCMQSDRLLRHGRPKQYYPTLDHLNPIR